MAARLSALRAGRTVPPARFLVLISVRNYVTPYGKVKNSMSSSAIQQTTFRLVALYLKQLHHNFLIFVYNSWVLLTDCLMLGYRRMTQLSDGTRRFITVFTRARHRSLPYLQLHDSSQYHPIVILWDSSWYHGSNVFLESESLAFWTLSIVQNSKY
jgi:hypothetical protein